MQIDHSEQVIIHVDQRWMRQLHTFYQFRIVITVQPLVLDYAQQRRLVLRLNGVVLVQVTAVQVAVQQADAVVQRKQIFAIPHQILVQQPGDRPVERRQLTVQLAGRIVSGKQCMVHRLQIMVAIQLLELALNRLELFDLLRQTIQLVQIVQGGSIESAVGHHRTAVGWHSASYRNLTGQTEPAHQLLAQLPAEVSATSTATAQHLAEAIFTLPLTLCSLFICITLPIQSQPVEEGLEQRVQIEHTETQIDRDRLADIAQ